MSQVSHRHRFTSWPSVLLVWTWAFLFCLVPCYGQIVTASLGGIVTDPAGSVVPGAAVTATNTQTGIVTKATSDSAGFYLFPSLSPANYTITVEKPGFSATVISGITLQVNQQARVDAKLKVGAVTTTVQVSGAAPMVQTETASIGTVITGQDSVDLPLNLRRFSALAELVPGVLPDNGGFASRAYGSPFSEVTFQANGNRDGANNPLLDGMDSRNITYGGFSLQPPPDAIQEFKIQTNIYSAAFGKTAGSTINLVTKSGTNQYHGVAWEFVRNWDIDARNFFAQNKHDAAGNVLPGTARPQYQRNQFGFDFGGPIRKNKTFAFGYYEGFRQIQGNVLSTVLPTPSMLKGNFSSFLTGSTVNLCGAGGPANLNYDTGQLFNPATESLFTCPAGSAKAGSSIIVGTPVTGNLITSIDPTAQKVIPYWPTPTSTTALPGAPNFTNPNPNTRGDDQFGVRVDHVFGPKDQLFSHYFFGRSNSITQRSFKPFTDQLHYRGQNAVAAWTHTFGPQLLNEASIGYQKNWNVLDCGDCPYPAGFLDGFGITGLVALPPTSHFPAFSVGGFSTPADGTYRPLNQPDSVEKYMDNITWIHGRHTVVVGADIQFWQALRNSSPYAPAGQFSFSGQYSSLGQEIPGVPAISGLADFEQGWPSRAETTKTFSWEWIVGGSWLSPYIQDDFRITRTLSLNYGLRWEYRGRPREKRLTTDTFVPLGPKFSGVGNAILVSPLPADQNDALCTTNPWLLSPSGQCLVATSAERNALGFGGSNTTSLMQKQWRDFAPRLGLAWRPTNSDKLVIRTGVGEFIDQPIMNGFSPQTAPWYLVDGLWNASTGLPPETINGLPVTTKNAVLKALQGGTPSLSSQEIASNPPLDYQNPRVQEWSFGIDSQLAQNWALDVTYVGNKATHLNNLHLTFNQPLPGVGVQANRRPYPDFAGNLVQVTSDGNSNYNALQVQLTKRVSSGLSFRTAYTYGKGLDDSEGDEGFGGGIGNFGPQDDNNFMADRGRSYNDERHRFVTSYIWQLPFGKGRQHLNRGGVADAILGGWAFSGIVTVGSGFPVTVESATDFSNTGSIVPRPDRTCSGEGAKTLTSWFNTTCFPITQLQAALQAGDPRFGNSGRNILDGRGSSNLDFTLNKSFRLTERFNLQFRSEFYNSLNQPHFGNPNMTIGSATVGVTSSAGQPRDIQFGLKLEF
jgi:hypothetical protein